MLKIFQTRRHDVVTKSTKTKLVSYARASHPTQLQLQKSDLRRNLSASTQSQKIIGLFMTSSLVLLLIEIRI